MEITYRGGRSFRISDERVVAINPPARTVDLTLHSRRKDAAKQRVSGPGEYEIGGILIATVPVGPANSPTLAHAVDIEGTNVLYVDGEVDRLSADALLAIGTVDILIVEAEDLATAQKVAQDLTPRVVIPFGSKAAELCAALGVRDAQPTTKFTWNGSGKAAKAVLLKAPGRGKRAA